MLRVRLGIELVLWRLGYRAYSASSKKKEGKRFERKLNLFKVLGAQAVHRNISDQKRCSFQSFRRASRAPEHF